MNLIQSDILIYILWILGTLLLYLLIEVSVTVNILKTDKGKSSDVLCDVEEYEYCKQHGLPVPPHLSGWDFHLTMLIFNILYGDWFNIKQQMKIMINNNKSKMKQTKQFLRPLLMAIVMMVGMLVPQGAWAQSSPVTVGDQGFTDTKEVEIAIDPNAHDYHVQLDENEKPVFVWSEDYTTATLQVVCSHNAEHTANVEVTGEGITSAVTTPATCITTGVRTYTATATYEGVEYTGTKEVEIPATDHSYTSQTLTADPVEDRLYAYACDNGCGEHNDAHIIKDFNGAGNHLELTKDGEGNYSTSEDITLADANGFVSPVDFTAPRVTYTRTGIKNQFGTLVVPFDVNGMGADYDLYKLDQVTENELVLRMVDKDDNGGIVPAGTPVVFRLHDYLAGDYSLTLTAANTTVSGQLAESPEANGYQVVGTYETTVLDENDYFISNNQFWRVYDTMVEISSWGVKVAPFRAYIHPTEAGAKANSLSIRIADEDDDVTAVETLNALTEGNAEYYDMNGRKLNSLQNGVNIVKYGNGKTVKVNIK